MLRSNQLSYTTEQAKIVNHFDCGLLQHLEQQRGKEAAQRG